MQTISKGQLDFVDASVQHTGNLFPVTNGEIMCLAAMTYIY